MKRTPIGRTIDRISFGAIALVVLFWIGLIVLLTLNHPLFLVYVLVTLVIGIIVVYLMGYGIEKILHYY